MNPNLNITNMTAAGPQQESVKVAKLVSCKGHRANVFIVLTGKREAISWADDETTG